ncbi:MAG: hypothetical protein ACREDP_11275 [Bradyrhizobium sp.]
MGLVRRQQRRLCTAAAFLLALTIVVGGAIAQDAEDSHPTLGTIPPLQPPPWVDERDDVVRFRQWLLDGRLAVAGNTAPRENGYLRIIDPKTMAEEDYYMVGGDGIGPINRFTPSVVVIGDAVFFLNSYGNLMRATKQQRLMAHIDLGLGTEEYATAASGVILADGNSVLVSWWESVPSRKGYCGDGAVVARVSAEGEFLWRWRDRQGGGNFPNDMVILKDGTMLILIGGRSNEYMGLIWYAACEHDYEYLVALSPDGQEIARRSIPRNLWLGPLSLGWDQQEVVAAAGYPYSVPDYVVRIRVGRGQLELDRVPIARNITSHRTDGTFAISLETGGYELRVPGVIEAIIDESGNLVTTRQLWTPPEGFCEPGEGKDEACSNPKSAKRPQQ